MKVRTQTYHKYTQEDYLVWKTLFDRQLENLKDKACSVYLKSLKTLGEVLNANKIPNFNELDGIFQKLTGWSIEVVEGLIPVDEFFALLSQKKFPSSIWLRAKEQLDYLQEPDMFHDIFGHIPQLADENYSSFMQKFGKIGSRHKNNPNYVVKLQRLYWYTIEFGLIREKGQQKIYGAGIVSSFKETNHTIEKDIVVLPYDIKKIMETEFIISEIQDTYFEIESFQQLYESLNELEKPNFVAE